MESKNSGCLVCKRSDQQIPLIQLVFRGQILWICPEHMPILIHNTDKFLAFIPDEQNEE